MRVWTLLCVVGLFTSCVSTQNHGSAYDIDVQSLARIKMKFVFEDIPPSYWDHFNDDGTMFFDFFLINNGLYLNQENVAQISVMNESGVNWTLKPTFYTTSIGGWFRCSDSTLSIDRSVLSVQKYTIDFELKSGGRIRKVIDLPSLLSTSGTYSYVFSNSYAGKKDSNYLSALVRPRVEKAYIDSGKLNIDFVVNDKRVRGFDILLDDSKNNSVGDLKPLVNDLSGQVSKQLNDGTAFYTDGRMNHLILDTESIEFYKEKSMKDIENIVINVSDRESQGHRSDYVEFQSNSDRTKIR